MSEKKSAELRRWEAACLEWRNRLDLWDWELKFEIVDAFDDTTTQAECRAKWEYKIATVAARGSFVRNAFDDEIRTIACHEMLHIRFDRVNEFVRAVTKALPVPARNLLRDQWDALNEEITTNLQRTLCRPWITWGDGPERDLRPGAP